MTETTFETVHQLERLIALLRNQDVTITRAGEDIETHLAPAVRAVEAARLEARWYAGQCSNTLHASLGKAGR